VRGFLFHPAQSDTPGAEPEGHTEGEREPIPTEARQRDGYSREQGEEDREQEHAGPEHGMTSAQNGRWQPIAQ
jgi:hypothetical protein